MASLSLDLSLPRLRIGAVILLLILLVVQSRQTMVEVEYSLNRAYIANVLCVEKDRPESSCQGKCHLKKELAKVEKTCDERPTEPITISLEELRFISQTHLYSMDDKATEVSDAPILRRVDLHSEDHSYVLFTPPEWG